VGELYLEITILIGLATVLALIFRLLKQPPILSYILAGIIVGPVGLFHISNGEVLHSFAEIGITLLLFMLGLEMKFKDLRSVGKVALYTGIGQIVFTSVIGFGICLLLGFSALASLYIAVALTFSSTIIVVKLLSDKKDLKSLYGKISVGFLLVQDFVAIIALIILSGFNTGDTQISPITFLLLTLKAAVIFGWVILLSKTVLPRLMNFVAKNTEILFLFSLAWAFSMAAFVSSPLIGFSIEIGGFLAGLALANTAQNIQIVSRVRSLRDFFITIFFVTLGMKMIFADFSTIFLPSVLLSLFVLIGNPIIVMIILGLMGYRSRTSFMAGLTVAQISEFSLIVIFMGNKIGHVDDSVVSLLTIVGAVTFIISTYMIMNSNYLYKKLSPILKFFERKEIHEILLPTSELKKHVVLIGANRMGESILEALLAKDEKVVVIDFDPDVIDRLKKKNIQCYFGDVADPEIQEHVNITDARLIMSTVPDVDDNLLMLQSLKRKKKDILIVVFALETDDAKALYKAGADYVVLPHLAGGRHIAKILVDEKHLELIEEYRMRDKNYLE
jgi:Kef-type K+ transport system membrane component KefB